MLCERCKKNTANTLIRENVNGVLKEMHLCSSCAKEAGYHDLFNTHPLGFDHILDSFLKDEFKGFLKSGSERERCEGCGMTFEDIAQSGKVGCAKCYQTFKSLLAPSLKRIHGNTQHTGKVPSSAGEMVKKQNEIKRLKEELNQMIAQQNFEEAAKLRDQIRAMESEGEQHA